MAGFFGLFDYSKPGPGVSKNAPEKKRFFVFWELYFRKFFRLVVANLLYVLVSLPLVTGGMAQAGLTFVTRNYVREKHVFLPEDFFNAIKKNWKQALAMQLIDFAVSVLMINGLIFYGSPVFNPGEGQETSFLSMILFAVMLSVTMLWRVMQYYVYLQMITFRLSLKQILKNSVRFVVIGAKQNVLISAVLLLLYGVLFICGLLAPIVSAVIVLLFILVIPAFRSFLIQFLIFPVVKKAIIDPYYKEHPDEDVQARLDLNLETNQQPVEEETIFEDRGETELPTANDAIPRQYTADEMRRAKRLTKNPQADDDGTI